MIRGIGVDIVEIERIESSIRELGDRFLQKIFTPHEIGYSIAKQNSHQHFAARFAAKEALSKAIATGWSGGFRWQDVEVVNAPSGKPAFEFHGAMQRTLAECNVFLSLSHSESHVVAMVIIEHAQQ